MSEVIVVDKPVGLTPLQALDRLRVNYPIYEDQKLTYAGRLDPLASGLMLILSGEAVKRGRDYWGLDKEYEMEILLGISTDTGDVLGLIEDINPQMVAMGGIDLATKSLLGVKEQLAPRFSSPGLDGKKFSRKIEIEGIEIGELKTISTKNLLENVHQKLNLVKADFRQSIIWPRWEEKLKTRDIAWQIIPLTITCSAGSYMRVLAFDFGKLLGQPALAYSIRRTKVGSFDLSQARALPKS